MFLKVLTVVGLATFEVYAAIPAGFAFQLLPIVIFMASTLGGLIGVFVTAYLGKQLNKIRAKFSKEKTGKKKVQPGFILKIWEKYGVIGLGFVGTMTVGAPISLSIGIGFNVPVHKMVIWCCLGVVTRCTLFTALGYYGMKLF